MKVDENLVVVVTGGASGLGAATAQQFARNGAKVVVFDKTEPHPTQFETCENTPHFISVNVTDEDSVASGFVESRSRVGTERVVVNCAGIAPASKTVSQSRPHSASLFREVLNVNLVGSFLVSAHAAAEIAQLPANSDGERGVIINTASIAAFDGQIGQVAYSASKGAISAMTLPMARDLSQYGIRVLAIAPGIFRTAMVAAFPEEIQAALCDQVPFPRRLGDPDEYAKLAAHIVENGMLNGEVIRIDGAIRMSPR